MAQRVILGAYHMALPPWCPFHTCSGAVPALSSLAAEDRLGLVMAGGFVLDSMRFATRCK